MAMFMQRFVMFNSCNREASGRENNDGVCRTWFLYLTSVTNMVIPVLIQPVVIYWVPSGCTGTVTATELQ